MDWIISVVAFLALLISGFNSYILWRDRSPRLQVSADQRYPEDHGDAIYSCRIANKGSVPTEIRAVRLLVGEGARISFPAVDDTIERNLWKNEKDVTKDLPYLLPQGQSVRFAAPRITVEHKLANVGIHGKAARFQVEVVDSIGKEHKAGSTMYVTPPIPDP